LQPEVALFFFAGLVGSRVTTLIDAGNLHLTCRQGRSSRLSRAPDGFAAPILGLTSLERIELHVGLKGTMNALFLKDLAVKVQRGLRGRIEAGRSGGGNSYGYKLIVEHDSRGERVRGGRKIDPAEAAVVQRIFRSFVAGSSPRSIAGELNRAGIPGPSSKDWGASTIHGNWRRGTGILNNELYIGRLIWNRQRFVKDPETGKRIAKPNPPNAWIQREVPELRIIDDETWAAAKARQTRASRATRPDCTGQQIWQARRPKHLFSGRVRCAVCHGPMIMVGGDSYGCANRKNKGTCDNAITMRREVLERSVLSGLKTHLLSPELVKEFISEFHRETNRLNTERGRRSEAAKAELARVEVEIRHIIAAVKQGMVHASMQDALTQLEKRKATLACEVAATPLPPPVIHPNLAELYRRKVDRLHECLTASGTRTEAAEALRCLVDEIRLVPQDGALAIDLYGELGAILALTNDKAASGRPRSGHSTLLVAGEGYHLYRTAVRWG